MVAVLSESPETGGSASPSVIYRTYSSSSKRKASEILPELQKFHKNSQRRARRSSIWLTNNNDNGSHISHDHGHSDNRNGDAFSHPPRLSPPIGKDVAPKPSRNNRTSLSPDLERHLFQ